MTVTDARPHTSPPPGAGKIQIFPSVITPSTSNKTSLILFALSIDIPEVYQHKKSQTPRKNAFTYIPHKESSGLLTPYHKDT